MEPHSFEFSAAFDTFAEASDFGAPHYVFFTQLDGVCFGTIFGGGVRRRFRVVRGHYACISVSSTVNALSDMSAKIICSDVLESTMADDWKEPYPDDIDEKSTGWPEDDVELDYDRDPDPKESKEPYPAEMEGGSGDCNHDVDGE
jgi:hypothetical protein